MGINLIGLGRDVAPKIDTKARELARLRDALEKIAHVTGEDDPAISCLSGCHTQTLERY
jgi:hypothetical protein